MAHAFSTLVQLLRRAAAGHAQDERGDAELLSRFVQAHDEAAFESLVRRHGPMVWSICRRFLAATQDAEDAFQATFLVFVRKSGSIRAGALLSNWLYGVAYRTANRARANGARRGALEKQGLNVEPCASPQEPGADWSPLLHEELFRLPDKYRQAIVLCYLQGKTNEEAAQALGWPVGTVKGRLSRARDLLRGRLTRRGVVLSVEGLAVSLAASRLEAAASPILLRSTIEGTWGHAAGHAAAGLSPGALTLSRGVMHAMFCKQLAAAGKALALVILLGVGTGLSIGSFAGDDTDKPKPQPVTPASTQKTSKPVQQPDAKPEELRATIDSMKYLGLAMHNHVERYGSFPPAAVYSKQGKPLLSWRVLLLPFLEEEELFRQFKLSEPWDSTHNKKLLERMPKIYAAPPGRGKDPHATFFQVFTGKNTIFEGSRGARLSDITDGTSNTILIIVAGKAVPWTKPADLVYDAKKPLPALGGVFPDGFHIGLADGSARFCKKRFREDVMRLMITRNDGQPFPTGLDD
jgi:RNA polymerase sigma factor (sigma-70 family)